MSVNLKSICFDFKLSGFSLTNEKIFAVLWDVNNHVPNLIIPVVNEVELNETCNYLTKTYYNKKLYKVTTASVEHEELGLKENENKKFNKIKITGLDCEKFNCKEHIIFVNF